MYLRIAYHAGSHNYMQNMTNNNNINNEKQKGSLKKVTTGIKNVFI